MNSLMHIPDSVEDEFRFINNESESVASLKDGYEWAKHACIATEKLQAALSGVSDLETNEGLKNLHVLSTEEIVNMQIQKFVNKQCTLEELHSIDTISRHQAELMENIELPSMRLKEYAANNPEMLKNARNVLPTINAVKRVAVYDNGKPQPIVSVQVYKTMSSRETKVLEIELLLTNTVLDLFNLIVENQPETKMFDGPSYAGSGMIIIGDRMYITGPEDYAAPYHSWASQYQIPHSVHPMDQTTLGALHNLPSLVANGSCCFTFFCGNEMRRTYFSGIYIKPADETNFPRVTYRRRGVRVQRCCLCTTRTADLIILNDVILPKNPSYTCNSCYRRLRAGPGGAFILPGPDVIVSPFLSI